MLALLVTLAVLALPLAADAAPAAPGFTVKLLDSPSTFDSRNHLGKEVVVVRFQASWCKPCTREAAGFARLVERYKHRGVYFIALQVQDTAADARRWVRAHDGGYAVALDPRLTIGNRFGISGTPYTIVIDRRGEIYARLRGQSAVTRLPKILDNALAIGPHR